jgi:hypothetical protein
VYEHETKLPTRHSAARKTTARNAFIVTADVKLRTGNTFMSTHYIHKICFTVTKKILHTNRISDKHDIDSSHININTSMKDKDIAKQGVQDLFTKAFSLF